MYVCMCMCMCVGVRVPVVLCAMLACRATIVNDMVYVFFACAVRMRAVCYVQEKEAIEKWLKTKTTSPMTGVMTMLSLLP